MSAGGFLVVLDRTGDPAGPVSLCDAADRLAARELGVRCMRRLSGAGGSLTVHGRARDADVSCATDPATGAWLVSIGTWLHDDATIANDAALLARWTAAGADRLAQELQGFFVVIAGDRDMRNVAVITDLIGSCRAYVRDLGDTVAVSGSSLLLAALRATQLDVVGCQEFLGCGIVYEDRSLYAGIRKLAPASVHRFRDGKPSSTAYWSVAALASESLRGAAAAEQFAQCIVESARRIGARYDRPVCDLTAGYDSRGLVAGLLTGGLSFTATVSGPEDSADVRISRELAQLAGLPHVHSPPTASVSLADIRRSLQLTHGEYDIVDYARILKTHDALAQRFQISLNGSYGEVARGYWWELLIGHTGSRETLDCGYVARRRFAPGFDSGLLPRAMRLDPASHFTGIARRTNTGLERHPNTTQMDHLYLMMRMRCWQGAIASSTNRLWPCLSPFMMRPVLETMLQATAQLRARSLLMRTAISHLQPRLANHPLEHGYPAVPARLTNLHRFLPLGTHYGRKVIEKAAHRMGAVTARFGMAEHGPASSPVIDAETRALLHSPARPLEELLDSEALEQATTGAVPALRCSRLLTVQLALRTLEAAR